ncbi:protein naked cuticle isoform X1 [Drosophila subpulchrella]|uniref:protein naked cuticle isoform X1 n=1 Tax=Drosophila subpulchrella TaxID=1486046 RepID=UPI0018A12F75|nr:protein naked cuticle isoform X1 [Drosophila subpulchrella]
MAGNIVKWWKHKILGGYKQFSVQECTTDSEELMYHQVRASSSCSAPPDLLLVSERDNNIQLRSPVVNIITTPPGNASSGATKQSHQHHQSQSNPHHHHHSSGRSHPSQPGHPQDVSSGGSHSKHLRISSASNGKHGKYLNAQQHLPQDEDVVDAAASVQQQHAGHAHSRHLHHHKEERIRLEEFTCDVSVEGGKSSQPLQFSFTFYDLDGHHGKITKDDIVGIVYTIYESIGKSVVVPHCGSKTINVRLTVSPEGKSKSQPVVPLPVPVPVAAGFGSSHASKLKKLPTGLAGGVGSGGTTALTTSAGNRRQHRYRPRKLIKSDDEDDDSNSEKEKDLATADQATGSGAKSGKGHHHQAQATRYHQNQNQNQNPNLNHSQKNSSRAEQCCAEQNTPDNGHNTYENMLNLKCCKPEGDQADCPSHRQLHQHHQNHQLRQQDIYMKQATQRVKMLRRARKQKYQDHCLETRQRSLSVGNDSAWQNRHLQPQQPAVGQPNATPPPPQPLNHKSASGSPPLGGGGDMMLDGVQLRQPRPQSLAHQPSQQQRKSAECWKSALNRNDLISIIRESMEKNRLCFQLNGKPQANVSPIRQPAAQQQQPQQQQRQRCNTGSKIPTLIANHSPVAQQSPLSCSPPTADTTTTSIPVATEVNGQQQQQQQHQPSPSSHPNANPNPNASNHNHHEHPQPHIPIYHQQLAINPAVLAAQQTHNTAHNKLNLCGYDSFLHATICGGGAAAHSPPATPSNVATVQPIPKKSQKNLLQGYQRLEQQQPQPQQQRSSKDYKNYGNLIYAKLSEQLQQKDREQRRQRHKQQQHQMLRDQHKDAARPEPRPPTSNSSSAGSKIYGDAVECAHLLASEEEDLPPSPQLTSTPSKVVSTDTLIDLNDDVGEAVAEAVTGGGKQAPEAEEPGQQVEAELDTSASSSMIHRYVHEHIHHHYHHFKEQQDV